MKNHTPQEHQDILDAERELGRALLCAQNTDELLDLLRDLCTPAELEAMVDRWRVVPLLRRGLAYREINDRTGVSVTTIGRISRFLDHGNGGYQMAYERLYPNPSSTSKK